jgi:septal ring factor EnvC (AmiA/AmiB activator)
MVGYTYTDFIYGIVVTVSGGLILLSIKCIIEKFHKWIKKIRELSGEVVENRKKVEKLENKITENRDKIEKIEKKIKEREQS